MKTIVLHIGYPKTGTSSLQWFLNTHRESLRQQGVCYPVTGQVADHAHHQLAFSLGANDSQQRGDERSHLFGELASEIQRCDADTVLLSSEVFLGNLERLQQSTEFASILSGRVLHVICVVRRQATFLESLYRQFIWDPGVRFAEGPDAFVKAYPIAGDYHAPLSMWAGWVGKENIVTVVYEQAQSGGGCIKHVCRLLGIDTTKLPGADFDVRRNVAMASALATEMMRTANGYSHLSENERVELTRRAREFAEMTSHLRLPTKLFTPDQIARIESRFLESNRRLADDFVHQPLKGYWFREELAEGGATV